jgi:hypothetical protein
MHAAGRHATVDTVWLSSAPPQCLCVSASSQTLASTIQNGNETISGGELGQRLLRHFYLAQRTLGRH